MKRVLALILTLCLFGAGSIPAFAETAVNVKITESDGAGAIVAALYEAGENATEDKPYIIDVGAGTYALDRGLHIFSNTTLRLNENAVIVDAVSAGDNMIKVGTAGEDPASGYYYQNITITGGQWDGGDKVATMFKFVHAKNCVLQNVKAFNLKDAHFVEIAGVNGMNIYNSEFSQMHVTTANGTEAVQIDVLQKDHIAGYTHLDDEIDLLCKNITISGCTFNGTRRAIGSHTAVHGKYFDGITITKNRFLNTTEKSILCCGMRNLSIWDNYICGEGVGIEIKNTDKTGSGIFLSAKDRSFDTRANIELSNAMISRNTVISKTNHAILINGMILPEAVQSKGDRIPAGEYYVDYVKIAGNTITAFGKYCPVKVQFSRDITVFNNTVTADSTCETAVYVCDGCKNVAVNSNSFYSKTVNGVRVANLNDGYPANSITAIKVNTFNAKTDYAIRMSDGTVGTVQNNTITAAAKCAIQVDKNEKYALTAAVSHMDSNVIRGAQVAIRVMGAGVGNITSNKIYPTKDNAIQIDSLSKVNTVASNVIATAGNNGIAVKKSVVGSIDSNVIKAPAKNGIYCYESANVSAITSNTISGAKTDGIRITESAVTRVTSNKISSCKENGINLYGSSKTAALCVQSNTVSSCSYGIRVAKGPKAGLYVNKLVSNKNGNAYLVLGSKTYRPANLSTVSLKAQKSGNTIRLSWSKKSTVSGYLVYRSLKPSAGYSKIGTAGANNGVYTDKTAKAKTVYYYRLLPYYKVPGSGVTLYANVGQSKAVKR